MNPLYPLRVPVSLFPQASFDPRAFRADIISFGGGEPNIRWERYFPCPCLGRQQIGGRSAAVGMENETLCPRCGGGGAYWKVQPDTYAIISARGAQVDKNGKLTGTSWNDVTARFSLLPENAPAHNDRLTVLNDFLLVHELKKKRASQSIAMRFPIVERAFISAVSPELSEVPMTTYESVLEIAWADPSGAFQGELTEGWEVVDGVLVLDDALEIPVNSSIAVSYWAHPRYIVMGHSFISRGQSTTRPEQIGEMGPEGYTELPVSVTGSLELVGLPSGAPAPNATYGG